MILSTQICDLFINKYMDKKEDNNAIVFVFGDQGTRDTPIRKLHVQLTKNTHLS